MNTINFWNNLKLSLIAGVILLLLVSGVYPLIVWGVSQAVFPKQARGSLITNEKGVVVGSALLAQGFTSVQYFHPRPSKAGGGFDATSSGGSNWGPASQTLMDTLKARAGIYRQENGLDSNAEIPGDAVTASGSGLDPDISLDNALLQVGRVAKARGMDSGRVEKIVREKLQGRDLGVLGEWRVNVLLLNLTLDELK